MNTENLYKHKNQCCGCELCVQSCPKSVIRMVTDDEGFLYPKIEDSTNCIDCGLCLRVCPMKKAGHSPQFIKRSFSFSLTDNEDLKQCASGGLATAISKSFIENGGVVYGARYSSDFLDVCYGRASTIEELNAFRGSKYAQATKKGIYSQVKKDLNEGRKVLYIALPCDTSAVYNYCKNHVNLYTISLICHGPTSPKVHKDYCASIPYSSKSSLAFFSVRYKDSGWKPYYVYAAYNDGSVYKTTFNDSDYGIAFQYLKRPSCRICKYKYGNSQFGLQADLTVGDYHGVSQHSSEYNKWGVSQGSIHTEKGEYLVSLLPSESKMIDIPFSKLLITNRALFKPIPQPGSLKHFMRDYNLHTLHYACSTKYVRFTDWRLSCMSQIARIFHFKRIIKRIISKL